MCARDPLAEIDALRAHPAVVGLRHRRTTLVEDYARAGDPRRGTCLATTHLRDLTALDPLNERAQALLMTALAAASGHQAAMRSVIFEEVRRQLDEELGILPCAELVLHAQEDPATGAVDRARLLMPRRAAAVKARRRAVPRD